MTYSYSYKTSDGVRHEAALDAPSREEAFAALRRQGIRPIKVVAADGSKANGEIRGVRKRVVAAVAAVAALAVGVVAYVGGTRSAASAPDGAAFIAPRHQIYGDPVIMDEFGRGQFGKALPREGDRLLAWFAEPGRLMCPKGSDPRRPGAALLAAFAQYAHTELDEERDLDAAGDVQRETRELKQIVNGIRAEMRAYLANGNGTAHSFWRRLVERTQQEMQICERTRRELEGEKDERVWEQKNAALRRLGLRTIPNPKDAE